MLSRRCEALFGCLPQTVEGSFCSLTAAFSTLGYVRCQDLRKSFDSPDQLVMVIRAPPETQMQVTEPSEVRAVELALSLPFEACSPRSNGAPPSVLLLQGYQVSLKSTQGPIDVFLCPEDSSGVCSPVTGGSPTQGNADPSLVPPPSQAAEQLLPQSSAAALEVGSSSPASTSSTVTAASQQETSALTLGGDTGECSEKRC